MVQLAASFGGIATELPVILVDVVDDDLLEVLGKKAMTLRGPTISHDFKAIVQDYIERRFGAAGRNAAE